MTTRAPLRSRIGEFLEILREDYPATTTIILILVVGAVVGLIFWTEPTLWVLLGVACLAGIVGIFLLIAKAVEEHW